MINGIYKMFKSNEQTEANKQKEQLSDVVVDAVVFIVRLSLVIGFVLGAIGMAIVDRIVN